MKTIYSVICLLVVFAASAQNYNELINSVIANNPEIMALEAATESDLLSIKSENNLPETDIEFEHQWGQKDIGNKWSFGISQGFEWPGVYGARRQATKSASEAMQYLTRSNYLDKMLEVKLLFIDIVNTRKNIEIMSEVCDHMAQLKAKYHDGYQQGEVSILDVNKIDIEYIATSRRCNELATQLSALENSLLTMNGGKDCSHILDKLNEYPQDMIHSVDEYTRLIQQYDPQVNYNMHMTRSQASMAKASRLKNLPGFSLGYMHVNELGEHFNGLKIGISLPLFSNRNKTKAANAMLHSMEYIQTDIVTSKLSAMYSDRAKAIVLFDEVNEYKPIFEQSNNIALLKKALDGGEISLLTYLQEVNYFLQAQQEYINIIHQYHSTLARLNKYSLLAN